MPLNVSVMAADPGKRPGTAQSGGEGIGVSGQQSGPSEFIKKLYKMLEEESVLYRKGRAGQVKSEVKRGSVGWGRGGTSFVVWDMNDFTTKVL
jgi:osomolarity two-component system response regulator SKN7